MPAWSSSLFMCFPSIHSCSHTKDLNHHLLTLMVVQVWAIALRLECKSAWSTSHVHTFAYIRPYILGEHNSEGWVSRVPRDCLSCVGLKTAKIADYTANRVGISMHNKQTLWSLTSGLSGRSGWYWGPYDCWLFGSHTCTMYILNMVIILVVMYSNVITAIDKIYMYFLHFNTCVMTTCDYDSDTIFILFFCSPTYPPTHCLILLSLLSLTHT